MLKKKVIVCDDDEGILDMISMVLESDVMEVITESNSLNLQHLIAEQRPDILLLDLWMPVLSGDLILKQLREQDKTSDLPVIVISASRDGKQIAMENGATDFLAKPFDLDELLRRISQLIEDDHPKP